MSMVVDGPVEHHMNLVHIRAHAPAAEREGWSGRLRWAAPGYGWTCDCGAGSYGWGAKAEAQAAYCCHERYEAGREALRSPSRTLSALTDAIRTALCSDPTGRLLPYHQLESIAHAAAEAALHHLLTASPDDVRE